MTIFHLLQLLCFKMKRGRLILNNFTVAGSIKMRKTLISILIVFCAGNAFTSLCFSSDLTSLIIRVKKVLPEKWELIEAQAGIVPKWALSQQTCIRLTVVGPVKSGYRFFDRDHQLILYQDTHQEAVYLWVAESDYNSGWTLLKKIKNQFSICPSWRPKELADKYFKVFGRNGWYTFDHNYTKESPKGTLEARFKKAETSWPTWENDVTTAFQ